MHIIGDKEKYIFRQEGSIVMKNTFSPEAQKLAQSLAEGFVKDPEAALFLYDVAQEKAQKEAPNYSEWTTEEKWTFAMR